MRKMLPIVTIVLIVFPIIGCQRHTETYKEMEIMEGNELLLRFSYPNNWDMREHEEFNNLFIVSNPTSSSNKYRGSFRISVFSDKHKELFIERLENRRDWYKSIEDPQIEIANAPTLLFESKIPYDNFDLYWFQSEEPSTLNDMGVDSVNNNIYFHHKGWTFFIGHEYPVADREGSFARGLDIVLETLEVGE
jgi:hypothetical protein